MRKKKRTKGLRDLPFRPGLPRNPTEYQREYKRLVRLMNQDPEPDLMDIIKICKERGLIRKDTFLEALLG